MRIRKIKLYNFKSFGEVEIELHNMNVLIGANASGKSNFLQALRFLRDLQQFGLEDAVSLQGGIHYLKNVNVDSKEITIMVSFDSFDQSYLNSNNGLALRNKEVTYQITLEAQNNAKNPGFKVKKEGIFLRANIGRFSSTEKSTDSLANFTLQVSHCDAKPEIDKAVTPDKVFDTSSISLDVDDIYQNLFSPFTFYKEFLIESLGEVLGSDFYVPVYEFLPNLSRRAVPITGKSRLDENGENLALVLKRILGEKESERKFLNLLSAVLPFVESVDVENFYDKSLLFKFRENFSQEDIPSYLLSNGTLSVTMMVVALYFENYQIIAFEETAHGVHPNLLSGLMNLFYEVSLTKQIFITTQNPEVVKHSRLEDLLLVTRQKSGSSVIIHPDDSTVVHTFLENELGVDNLFAQNLLDL